MLNWVHYWTESVTSFKNVSDPLKDVTDFNENQPTGMYVFDIFNTI